MPQRTVVVVAATVAAAASKHLSAHIFALQRECGMSLGERERTGREENRVHVLRIDCSTLFHNFASK